MSRRLTAHFLILVCMLVQIASVMPHHHHNHLLCLHDDLKACSDCIHSGECGCGNSHEQDGGHHSCESSCVTHFVFSETVVESADALPDYTIALDLYTLYNILTCATTDCGHADGGTAAFVVRLHDSHVVGSKGLRSPPCLV